MDQNKQKALAAALGQIEKQFGKGSIMRLGDSKTMDIEAISHRLLSLDVALGIGGLPCGRIVEIYGPESSGKTTLTLQVIAEAQKGKTWCLRRCGARTGSRSMPPSWASTSTTCWSPSRIPVNRRWRFATCWCAQCRRRHHRRLRGGLTPKAEIEGEMGDSHVGLQARLMSQALRKLTANIKNANCHVHLHQPDPDEDRCHVRQPGDHHRW